MKYTKHSNRGAVDHILFVCANRRRTKIKFEIIVPEKQGQSVNNIKIIGANSPLGDHYCPCCRGFGKGIGISLCGYCKDRLCGDERQWFDSHPYEVKVHIERMLK